ncbi:MAG: RNA methyltransferase [Dysgonamonadaceae bacterium]|jgi:TrmH family RNA methyltransferase|nr:RNA methyltransferase [Dysgonamonadaceae bacterium]
MLSKSKIKYIRSLAMKKFRNETGCFLAEGNKLVKDILPYFECELLIAKPAWIAGQGDLRAGELIAADNHDIEKASLLKTPQDVIAVFKQPDYQLDKEELKHGLSLVSDGVQDPGNMGTIVRLADWFGIRNVICSPDSVDIFNPKTVQATMGAIARVRVVYAELPALLSDLNDVPIYGAFLEGNSIYEEKLSANGLIVMGNEGKGIRRRVAQHITRKLYIPNYPPGTETTESLNVAVATAIICNEFRRQSQLRN